MTGPIWADLLGRFVALIVGKPDDDCQCECCAEADVPPSLEIEA